MIKLPSQIISVLTALENAGFDAYIVGGCVRDSLLGIAPEDYDVATSAKPFEIKKVFSFAKLIETGISHGTVTVIIDDMPIEITTFRVDANYSDGRHPDSVSFTDRIEQDLSRRDFTINAMAYSKSKGLIDIFNGQADLNASVLRCVGNPDDRFKEDSLRILRCLRFASSLQFTIDKETELAMYSNKALLENISKERILSELIKILCGKGIRPILNEYAQILSVPIPEIAPMIGFDQKNFHHIYNVLEHTSVVVENTPPQPVLRLTALFHDIGKPSCFTLDSSGVGHFRGHGNAGAIITKNILTRLKANNQTIRRVVELIQWHDEPIRLNPPAIKRIFNKLSPPVFFDLLNIKRADNLGQNIAEFNHLEEYNQLERMARDILSRHECYCLNDMAISGKDLIGMGLKGAEIGEKLNILLEAVIEGRVDNNKQALIEFIKLIPAYHS